LTQALARGSMSTPLITGLLSPSPYKPMIKTHFKNFGGDLIHELKLVAIHLFFNELEP